MKLPRYLSPVETPYYIQGHIAQSLSGIFVARAIAFVKDSYVLVRVANVTSVPVTIRKNLRIAQVNPSAASKTDSPESEQTLPSASSFAGSVESEDTRPITIDDFDLSHIPEPYKSQLADMLMKHVSAFGTSLKDIKSTNVYEHHI